MTKQIINRQIDIEYGHTLPNHYSFCNQIHGHHGVIVAEVEGEINKVSGDSSEGMVMDFSSLKQIMMEEIFDKLDHGFAVWEDSKKDLEYITKRNKKYIITSQPPTAEYLAKWCYQKIDKKLPAYINLIKVTFYETPNNWAIYSGMEDAEN